jgi:hypothetical protein
VTNRASAGNPLTRGTVATATAGADFRVGLGSALSLHGTINPDFGQVEVVPAMLNLSAVETFFPEKRPFFLEGSGIFEFGTLPVSAQFGFSRFVHWHRIGRTPQLSPASEFSDVPDQTTILGAAKLSGRTTNGLSLGFVDAVASRENATAIDGDGSRHDVAVEPRTNYLVARMKKDFADGRATLGIRAPRTFDFDVFGKDRGTSEILSDGRVQIDPDGGGAQPAFVLGDEPNETSFVSRAIRVNGVVRWEYPSGSAIYLVWQQTRDGNAALDDASLIHDVGRVFGVPAKDVVYLKISYRLGR